MSSGVAVELPENERAVDAAEGEVVRHDVGGINPAAFPLNVVEGGAEGVNRVQIKRRVEPTFIHHQDGKPGFDAAAGAERVADVALG